MAPVPITTLPKENWPPLLIDIPQQPPHLFIKGAVPDWNRKLLTVVGARKYSPYGKEVCERLIKDLSGTPVTIVSGLALGIDTIAHAAALAARLHTIAIPGSGLHQSVLYPASNHRLAERIVEAGGALLSEFEPDFKATVWSFPQRNRIMAGMSHATLVIEAEKKSGTLITARLATEYNRDVGTVPGSIFSPHTEGPHLLLRLGATPVTSASDILEMLHIPPRLLSKDPVDCSPEEHTLLNLLTEPRSRESLAHTLQKTITEINALLSIMELKDLVKEEYGMIRRC